MPRILPRGLLGSLNTNLIFKNFQPRVEIENFQKCMQIADVSKNKFLRGGLGIKIGGLGLKIFRK